jgi:AraC family transcriptional regulator
MRGVMHAKPVFLDEVSEWRDVEDSATWQRRESMSRYVIQAIIFMESCYGDALSLDRVAASGCVSRFHLARLFRVDIGMSPMEYVRWRRLMEAKRLLRVGRISLMSIATGLGYYDYSHFSRSFRSATGLRPTQYAATSLEVGRA